MPAHLAGIACHGIEPTALISPSRVWAYSDVSFYSTVKRHYLLLSHTSVISVTNVPGAIALARMLCLAYSDDKVFVKWFRAALLAL